MYSLIKVWDLPTRIFHWVLLLLFISMLSTGYLGGGFLKFHIYLGFLMCSLLIFRIVWGFVGGYWSRFQNFQFSLVSLQRQFKFSHIPSRNVGHSPSGSWSTAVILFLLFTQVLSGLVSDDEVSYAGPLANWISSDLSSKATYFHTHIGKVLLLIVSTLHIIVVLYHFFCKKDQLVQAMWTGYKTINSTNPEGDRR